MLIEHKKTVDSNHLQTKPLLHPEIGGLSTPACIFSGRVLPVSKSKTTTSSPMQIGFTNNPRT